MQLLKFKKHKKVILLNKKKTFRGTWVAQSVKPLTSVASLHFSGITS